MTHQSAAPQAGSGSDRQPADQRPGSLETLELRWFAPDRIPAAAIRWFENAAPQVLLEERIDSPAEGDRWVKVAKTVRTYPYRVTGSSVEGRCDIELAAVEVGGVEAWTMAFEASGPASERMATPGAAVEQLLSVTDVPAEVAAALELEAGYPAWLVVVTGT